MYPLRIFKLCVLILSFCSSVSARPGVDGVGYIDSMGGFIFDPINAVIFAFCAIFAITTAIQTILIILKILRRISGHTSSTARPELSLGYIFPTFLLLSTVALTALYVLRGIYRALGVIPLAEDFFTFTDTYLTAWSMVSFLQEILLISGVLALISHREKVAFDTSGVLGLKMIADTILVMILLALGIAYVELRAAATTASDEQTVDDVYLAYMLLFLLAALDVAISSSILHRRITRYPINDYKIASRLAFVISPCFMAYAIFYVILEVVRRASIIEYYETSQRWELAGVVIGCITECVIIVKCLGFWVPTLGKNLEGHLEGWRSNVY